MEKDQAYIINAEKKLKIYKEEISKIESDLKGYKSGTKKNLNSEIKEVKEKYRDVEKIIKELKVSTADNFEDVKERAVELFNELKEGLSKSSALLTKDNLIHAKDEATHFGKEKASEVEGYIKRNPVTSAVISLAVGFVVGQLLGRSK